MARLRTLVLLVCLGAILASGCSMFDSRSKRKAIELQQQNDELNTKLVAQMNEQKRLEAELAKAISEKNAAEQARLMAQMKAPADNKTSQVRMDALQNELGKLGKSFPGGVRIATDVLFSPGKTVVKSEAKSVLKKVANIVSKSGGDAVMYIDGHTDSDPLRVTKALYKDNYGLGEARAKAVANQLVSDGVPRSKIVTRSFGADHPIASNSTADGKRQNRRVEISLAYASAAAPAASGGAKVVTPTPAPPK